MSITSAPGAHINRRSVHFALASGGYSGCSPVSPGTVGSLGCLVLWYLLAAAGMCLSPGCDSAIWVTVLALAVWSTARCLAELSPSGAPSTDPQFVVIDEWVGLLIPLALTSPAEPGQVAAAFVLFRFFDIVKPPPVSTAERLPGAWGVIADDVVAGIGAAAVLYGGRMLGW